MFKNVQECLFKHVFKKDEALPQTGSTQEKAIEANQLNQAADSQEEEIKCPELDEVTTRDIESERTQSVSSQESKRSDVHSPGCVCRLCRENRIRERLETFLRNEEKENGDTPANP